MTAAESTLFVRRGRRGSSYGHEHLGHPDEVSAPTGADGNQADYAAWSADTLPVSRCFLRDRFMSERKFMASGHGGSSLSSTGDGSRDSDGQDGGHGRNSEGGGSGEK